MARGEGGGAAAEGRGRRLAKPGGRRTSRLLRARATNGGSIPFVPGLVGRQARSLRTRACAREPRRHPSLSPFVRLWPKRRRWQQELPPGVPRLGKRNQVKVAPGRSAAVGGRVRGSGDRAAPPRVPSRRSRERSAGEEARSGETSGQGMHVPSAAVAGERRVGRALRFL